MQKCPKCGEVKGFLDFYTNQQSKKRSMGWCKDCFNQYVKERWRAVKLKAAMLLGGKCSKCGYDKNLSAIDFHHIDPKEKDANVSRLMHTKWETIVKELKKCILLCRNCHSEIHNPLMEMERINGIHSFRLDRCTKVIDRKPPGSYAINETWSAEYSTGTCPCGNLVYGTKYCSLKCRGLNCRKVKRPDKEQLINDLSILPMTKIGAKYGVSDNSIRKWKKSYGL